MFHDVLVLFLLIWYLMFYYNSNGESRKGARDTRGAEKSFFGDPPPPHLNVWMKAPTQ